MCSVRRRSTYPPHWPSGPRPVPAGAGCCQWVQWGWSQLSSAQSAAWSKVDVTHGGQHLARFNVGFLGFRRPRAQPVHIPVVHAEGGRDQYRVMDFKIGGSLLSGGLDGGFRHLPASLLDRKSTRLNSSHLGISYAVFCLKK